jgi:lysophospholipase L1-like esterase
MVTAPPPSAGRWLPRLALVGLAPLWLAQALYIRRVTPRLPEPPGARDGRIGAGPVLRLLIAGDSAAAGVGVGHQDEALSGRLVADLAGRYAIDWTLLAETGTTTADLQRRLAQTDAHGYDVAVLSLGVNDVLALVPTARWLEQQRCLVELLATRHGVRRILLTAVPPMHRFRALPQPLRWLLGARAQGYRDALAGAIGAWPGCELVDADLPDAPEALASDGFHPGAASYKAWAERVAARIG